MGRYGQKTRPGEAVSGFGVKSSGGGSGSTLALASPTATTAVPGDGYKYFIFQSSGTIIATGEGPMQCLVVGGGSGTFKYSRNSWASADPYGNAWSSTVGPGGGGGAGGFLEEEAKMYEGTYTVTVGAGGSGYNGYFIYADGGHSSFIAEHPSHPGGPSTWSDIIAVGGGSTVLVTPANYAITQPNRTIPDGPSFQPDPYAPYNPQNAPDPANPAAHNNPYTVRLRWQGGSGSGGNAANNPQVRTPTQWRQAQQGLGQGYAGGNSRPQTEQAGPQSPMGRGTAGGGGGAGEYGWSTPVPLNPAYSPDPSFGVPNAELMTGGKGGLGKQSPLLTNILPSIPTLSSDVVAGGGGGGSMYSNAYGVGTGGTGQSGGGNGGPANQSGGPSGSGIGIDGAANTGGGGGGNGYPGFTNPPGTLDGRSGGSGIVVIRMAV